VRRAVAIVALALVLIGAVEALESARQIAENVGPLRLGPSGLGLSGLGVLASCAAYLWLGWHIARDRAALRAGAITGFLAGMIGGTVRAVIIADVVADAVARYATVPLWFVPLVLAVFVVGATVVSAVAGAALAFLGVRLERVIRSGRHRPPA